MHDELIELLTLLKLQAQLLLLGLATPQQLTGDARQAALIGLEAAAQQVPEEPRQYAPPRLETAAEAFEAAFCGGELGRHGT